MNDYPRCTVWLVEAMAKKKNTSSRQSASAVIISLKQAEGRWRNYLLTCAHVVKQYSEFLPRTADGDLKRHVLCHEPDKGYVNWKDNESWPSDENDGIYTGKVIDVLKRPAGGWSPDECAPEKDWVLIDVHEKSFQSFRAAKFSRSNISNEVFKIYGYPNGTRAFAIGEIVQNLPCEGFQVLRQGNNPNVLLIDGNANAAPGMSGGGLFDNREGLAGLYIGQDPDKLSKYAINSGKITDDLENAGFKCRFKSKTDIGSKVATFVTDLSSPAGIISKTGAVAALFSFLPWLCPAEPAGFLLALTTIAATVSAMLLAHLCIVWRKITVRYSLAACLGVLLLVSLNYSLVRHRLVQHIRGEWKTVGYDNTAVSLTDEAMPFAGESTSKLLNSLFETRDEVWKKSAIRKSQLVVFLSWILFWISIGVSISILAKSYDPKV